ncbi:butyryl-CoA dehydrogenase [Streptoalloteichus tenebrarius]|uniref:short-chain 2-methylacyl-CoA dehydrogenase n=1 Tax=Streptoalloteichus tenebrarius (strain ATCC 17920 / DSM 40477 / JCM 4838 / CBS 697.72 / NBRC 16177 / NCIMB 11028 / NRRL B-12390 / A12253. 1 / ISP 5477) TaxID=1933 RepID=A0ABT1HLG1_STRSD|nr:acyl-CoA dehydrogenase family protein [Streptoalloteichus tenebrarius]MCP2256362.1 butyryl-CoA dehydrogenase [Streptoalloteichus tenebrarius]
MSTATPPPALTRLSPEDAAWRDHVREFALREIAPLSDAMDRDAALDPGLRAKLFEAGLMAVEAPARYGGRGGSLFQVVLTIEEVARVDPGVAVGVDVHNALIVATLLRIGTGDQKRKYLPLLTSRHVGAFSLSEEHAGSDAFNVSTTATAKDGGYVLNGRKRWTSNAAQADLFLVFARVEEHGVSAFLVERTAEGLSIDPRTEQMGVRAASTADVILDDVVVRRQQCLGGLGGGEGVAIAALDIGRIGIAAQMVGLAQGALDLALGYSREREQFGQRIGSYQGVQFTLAEIATEVAAARALLYDVTRTVEAGATVSERLRLSAMAKYFASQVAQKAASGAVEVLGGNGYTREYPAERFFRDAKAGTIYEGTSNILLRGIAGSLHKGGS